MLALAVKLAYFVSHPIQYQAPLLRRIAREPDIELTVFYSSDFSVHGYADQGFGGVKVQWDIPLLEGYAHEFLPGFRRKSTPGFAAPVSFGILSRLRRGCFDAVWVHGYNTMNALHALMAARLLNIPAFVRTDSTLDDRPRGPIKLAIKKVFFVLLRQLIRGVLSVGRKNTEYWRNSLGSEVPMFPMPYAVDNDYFRRLATAAASDREKLRRDLGIKPGLPLFLFASKLQRRKRCMDLIEAFLSLAPAESGPPAYLLIAGDGQERAAIEARIRDSGAANIRMLGFQNQSELPRLFDLCDVFVLPSIHEPWGLIVNEVMNASRPVIVSDQVGCAPDLVRDGVNGFIFPAKNVDALRGALRRFVEDPSLALRMGREAAEMIAGYSFEQDVAALRRALAFAVQGFVA